MLTLATGGDEEGLREFLLAYARAFDAAVGAGAPAETAPSGGHVAVAIAPGLTAGAYRGVAQ